MPHLLSKIVAGGLSAAVILIWWPLVFPSASLESWLVRGISWTLCFELMLHAFTPIEDALWRSRAARRVVEQAQTAGAKLGAGSTSKRVGGRSVIAGVALLVPVALLVNAPVERLAPKQEATQVKHVTQVKRIVRVERRSVTVPRAVAGDSSSGWLSATAPTARKPEGAPHRRLRSPAQRAGAVRGNSGPRSTGDGRRPGGTAGGSAPRPVSQPPATGGDERSPSAPVADPKPRTATHG